MRWVQHGKDKISRGEVAAPEGDLFFVDGQGSRAVVGGVLYVDGKRAVKGDHKVNLKDEDVTLTVDSKGGLTRKGAKKIGA